jgi:hypothetical protein
VNEYEQTKSDLRTLVIRLLQEDEATMAPETSEVMRRLAPAIMKELGMMWTWPLPCHENDEAAEAAEADEEATQWSTLMEAIESESA